VSTQLRKKAKISNMLPLLLLLIFSLALPYSSTTSLPPLSDLAVKTAREMIRREARHSRPLIDVDLVESTVAEAVLVELSLQDARGRPGSLSFVHRVTEPVSLAGGAASAWLAAPCAGGQRGCGALSSVEAAHPPSLPSLPDMAMTGPARVTFGAAGMSGEVAIPHKVERAAETRAVSVPGSTPFTLSRHSSLSLKQPVEMVARLDDAAQTLNITLFGSLDLEVNGGVGGSGGGGGGVRGGAAGASAGGLGAVAPPSLTTATRARVRPGRTSSELVVVGKQAGDESAGGFNHTLSLSLADPVVREALKMLQDKGLVLSTERTPQQKVTKYHTEAAQEAAIRVNMVDGGAKKSFMVHVLTTRTASKVIRAELTTPFSIIQTTNINHNNGTDLQDQLQFLVDLSNTVNSQAR
jgi:hypothetical protein